MKKGKKNQPPVVANISFNSDPDGSPTFSSSSGQPPALEFNLFTAAIEAFKSEFIDKFHQARLQFPDAQPQELLAELFEVHQQDVEYETEQALAEGNTQKADILQSLLQAVSEAAEELVNKEVITPLKRKVQAKPDDANVHIQLGNAYYTIERYDDSIESFKRAIRLVPNASFSLGLAHNTLGHHTEAIEAFKEMLRIEPNSAQAHTALGGAYFHKERYQEAAKSLKEAIKIEPELPHAHYLLGLVHINLGDQASAHEEHRKLLRLDSSMAEDLLDNINQA